MSETGGAADPPAPPACTPMPISLALFCVERWRGFEQSNDDDSFFAVAPAQAIGGNKIIREMKNKNNNKDPYKLLSLQTAVCSTSL